MFGNSKIKQVIKYDKNIWNRKIAEIPNQITECGIQYHLLSHNYELFTRNSKIVSHNYGCFQLVSLVKAIHFPKKTWKESEY